MISIFAKTVPVLISLTLNRIAQDIKLMEHDRMVYGFLLRQVGISVLFMIRKRVVM